ncbi:ATP-binding protein [archaeon]|nr:ATP-binding protein [archaeon]
MDLKSIIKEQRQELEKIGKKERIIERERLNEARAYLKYPNIVVITGIRRCGKSIFSYLMEKNHKFAYINFDDERLAGLKTEELDKVLQAFYELYEDIEYIVLDEPQNIHGWELFANRLRRTKKVIITGSNSQLLSGELATHLTGRYINIKLFPFSFREFLSFKGFEISKAYTTLEKARILTFLREYLSSGGFPEVYKIGKLIILSIYETILNKDLILRYKINKTKEFKDLAKYLISNSSEEITYSRLSKNLEIKHISTVSNWISYIENAFLIFKLERFAFKLKQQFIAPKKVYCIDTGIVDLIGFKFSENAGKILENCVAIALQERKEKELGLEVYYWKDVKQNEVDFVVKKRTKVIQLIQATHINNRQELKEKRINSLIKASNELRCNNLIVITWDYESEEKLDGKTIKFIPLWKWLLENHKKER